MQVTVAWDSPCSIEIRLKCLLILASTCVVIMRPLNRSRHRARNLDLHLGRLVWHTVIDRLKRGNIRGLELQIEKAAIDGKKTDKVPSDRAFYHFGEPS